MRGKTAHENFWGRVRPDPVDKDACWGWVGAKTTAGYPSMWNSGTRMVVYAHRFSWEIHNAEELGKWHVLHSCDNPECCNPLHLIRGTHADNMRDMHEKGRRWTPPRGETNPVAKLSDADLLDIKKLRESSLLLDDIAGRYGVSAAHISRVLKGTSSRKMPI